MAHGRTQVLIEGWLSSLVSQQSYGPFVLECYLGMVEAGLLSSDARGLLERGVRDLLM